MSWVEIDVILQWLWYFIKHYINSDKIEFSTNLMNYYVTEEDQSGHFGQIPVDTRELIHQFLTKSFFVHGPKLFEGLFYNLTLLKRTTGGNEGYHHGTKNCVHVPKPSDDIGKSYQKINHLQTTTNMNQSNKCSQHGASQYGKMYDTEVRPVELS